jgi:ATP-binding cassette subfamily B protein IrtA
MINLLMHRKWEIMDNKIKIREMIIVIYKIAYKYKGKLLFMSFLFLVDASLVMISAYLNIKIYDYAIENKILSAFIILIIISLAVLVASNSLSYLEVLVETKLGDEIELDLQHQVFTYSLKITEHLDQKLHSGELDALLKQDIPQLRSLISREIPQIIRVLLQVAASSVILLSIEWKFSVIIILFQVFYIFFFKTYGKRLEKESKNIRKEYGQFNEKVMDVIKWFHEVPFIGASQYLINKMDKEYQNYVEKNYNYTKISYRGQIILSTYLRASSILILLLGGIQMILGEFTLGSLLVLTENNSKFNGSLFMINTTLAGVMEEISKANKVFTILKYNNKNCKSKETKLPLRITDISLNRIGYSYDHETWVFKKANMVLAPKEIIYLMGKSGQGKSTLGKILIGRLKIQQGNIKINGKKIDNVEALRENSSYMPQEQILFHDTIYENLRLGICKSKSEVEKVCRRVEIHEFIQKLPNQYDYVLEKGGDELSIGQKQRLCLARTLLQNKSIIVLDEVTSALDSKTASLIMDVIEEYAKTHIVLVITHNRNIASQKSHIFNIKNQKINIEVTRGESHEITISG